MNDPLTLITKPKAADDIKVEILDILRGALAEAEAGELDALILVKRQVGGKWGNDRSGLLSITDAVGRLEIIKQEYVYQYLALIGSI
jgi:hypothetical protein